jgi:GntR family transcriptional repressor for pyruvate dehydrogenase complex
VTSAGTIVRRRLYQQVAEDVERQILSGAYPADSRLPSEQDLAEHYGVSRNVVREALKSLKELGLVSIRTGSGTYIRPPSAQPVAEALQRFIRHSPNGGITIAQLYDVRRMVEPECARLAAERASAAEIAAIEQAQRTLEDGRDDASLTSRADLEFHLAIAAATHNPLVTTLLNPIIAPLQRMFTRAHGFPDRVGYALSGHPAILAAIRQGQPMQAFETMLAHIETGRPRFSGDTGLSPDDLV